MASELCDAFLGKASAISGSVHNNVLLGFQGTNDLYEPGVDCANHKLLRLIESHILPACSKRDGSSLPRSSAARHALFRPQT